MIGCPICAGDNPALWRHYGFHDTPCPTHEPAAFGDCVSLGDEPTYRLRAQERFRATFSYECPLEWSACPICLAHLNMTVVERETFETRCYGCSSIVKRDACVTKPRKVLKAKRRL